MGALAPAAASSSRSVDGVLFFDPVFNYPKKMRLFAKLATSRVALHSSAANSLFCALVLVEQGVGVRLAGPTLLRLRFLGFLRVRMRLSRGMLSGGR